MTYREWDWPLEPRRWQVEEILPPEPEVRIRYSIQRDNRAQHGAVCPCADLVAISPRSASVGDHGLARDRRGADRGAAAGL